MDQVHTLCLQALTWIAGQEDLVSGFFAQSGTSADELRARITEPEFLAAILDFILTEDQFVLGLARELGIAPDEIIRARSLLPGGDVPHWT